MGKMDGAGRNNTGKGSKTGKCSLGVHAVWGGGLWRRGVESRKAWPAGVGHRWIMAGERPVVTELDEGQCAEEPARFSRRECGVIEDFRTYFIFAFRKSPCPLTRLPTSRTLEVIASGTILS